MGMSLRKGEAALEKTATNNKAKSVLILNFWFLLLDMQASIAYKSLINTCSYTAYSKSWPAASEDLINKPPTNIGILNFIASTWAKSFPIPQAWKPAAWSFAIKLGGMSDFFFNRTCKAQSSLDVTKYWQLLRTHTSSASSCKQTNGNKSRIALNKMSLYKQMLYLYWFLYQDKGTCLFFLFQESFSLEKSQSYTNI